MQILPPGFGSRIPFLSVLPSEAPTMFYEFSFCKSTRLILECLQGSFIICIYCPGVFICFILYPIISPNFMKFSGLIFTHCRFQYLPRNSLLIYKYPLRNWYIFPLYILIDIPSKPPRGQLRNRWGLTWGTENSASSFCRLQLLTFKMCSYHLQRIVTTSELPGLRKHQITGRRGHRYLSPF
jgi:hypothetical protein